MRNLTPAAVLALGLVGTALPAAAEGAAWGYEGDVGPAFWGGLGDGFATCSAGERQSPVAVPGDAAPTTASLTFSYGPTDALLENNGHTIQVTHEGGSTLSIDGKIFTLLQFHFHTPAEHVVGGAESGLEMHMVHAAADGSLAVVGVLFDLGDTPNRFLASFWRTLPAPGQSVAANVPIDLNDAFDQDAEITSFTGSLTTPPCDEGVSWFLVRKHEIVSRDQVADLVRVVGFNRRPVQPLNRRAFGGY